GGGGGRRREEDAGLREGGRRGRAASGGGGSAAHHRHRSANRSPARQRVARRARNLNIGLEERHRLGPTGRDLPQPIVLTAAASRERHGHHGCDGRAARSSGLAGDQDHRAGGRARPPSGGAPVPQHVPGPVVKFYGVTDGRFFNWYGSEAGFAGERPAVDENRLQALALEAAAILGLEVFGGDVAFPEPDRPVLIDINDWPSFAPFRE